MRGFTLIELLAVIVILAIILLISIPIIGNVIESVKKEAFSSSSLGLVSAANQTYIKSKLDNYEGVITFTIVDGVATSDPVGHVLEMDGELPKNGTVKILKDGKVQISLHDGKYCAVKYENQSKVEITEKTVDLCIIDETAPVINLATNGGEFYYLSLNVDVTDFSEIAMLEYAFSASAELPATGWFTFEKEDEITYSGEGIYYLHVRATDEPGNTRNFVSNAFTLIDPITNFVYTGNYETFTVKSTGTYKLEVWGAKGGGIYGGKGGYATGEVNLTKDQVIYVYVGGEGKFIPGVSAGGFNGGGNSGSYTTQGGGGGATDFRLNNNALTDRIIVAGGGGGNGSNSGVNNSIDYGGAGGGLVGLVGTINRGCGGPGTQVNGGAAGYYSEWGSGTAGIFLVGGNGNFGGGGGGAGYYGGGGASWGGGGGGSSYVGTLANSATIDGITTMPNPLGGTQTGNATDGYARLTFLP